MNKSNIQIIDLDHTLIIIPLTNTLITLGFRISKI